MVETLTARDSTAAELVSRVSGLLQTVVEDRQAGRSVEFQGLNLAVPKPLSPSQGQKSWYRCITTRLRARAVRYERMRRRILCMRDDILTLVSSFETDAATSVDLS